MSVIYLNYLSHMDEKLPYAINTKLSSISYGFKNDNPFYTPRPLNITHSTLTMSGKHNYIEIDDNDDITSLILPQIKDSIKELLIIRNKKSTNIVLYSNIDSTIEDDNQLCLFSDTAIQLLHNNSDYWIIL